jgi:ribosomal protein S18 acetylase RimI-like enzyme
MITVSQTKDHELIASLAEGVQNLHYQMHPDIFKPYDKAAVTKAVQQFLDDPACRAYVATKGAVPVGYAIFIVKEVKENAFHYNISTIYIDQVAVLKEYQNSGAGKLLLDEAEKLANTLSIKKLELDHWTANTIAARYFRKNGYTLYKERLSKLIQ